MRALRIAVLFVLLALTFPISRALETPLSIPQFIIALRQLRQSADSASDSSATNAIMQQLPDQWDVETGTGVVTTSTDGLRQALTIYAKKHDPASLAAFTSQVDLLINDASGVRSGKINAAAARDKLGEILSRREFRKVEGETWYDRWKRAAQHWLAELLSRAVTSSAFPVVSRVVIWALLAAAVAIAALWVVRNYRQSNIYTTFSGSPDSVSAKPWRDWQTEAQTAAQEGRWRDAVHLSYWAGISFLESQGLWRPDRARTPREYLRLLPTNDMHREPLQQLTRSFEKVWYGTDPATSDTFAAASVLLEQMGCR